MTDADRSTDTKRKPFLGGVQKNGGDEDGIRKKEFLFSFLVGGTWGGGLLNAEDVETHVCAKFSRIRIKFIFFSEKLVKTVKIFMFLEQSDKVLQIERVF